MDDTGFKDVLKEDQEIAGNLKELFASVFTVEDLGQIPAPELTFTGK